MEATGYTGFIAESHLDLALGYLETARYDLAQHHGRLGLDSATEHRQIRNAHYLLGEIAHYRGDTQTAEIHFEHLCRFYPDFPQLKNLLYAIDLRGVINWKL
jgi:TolA-binding protein